MSILFTKILFIILLLIIKMDFLAALLRRSIKNIVNLYITIKNIMAGVFRFSNAVSDISKFIQTYCAIYEHFYPQTKEGEYFDHKEASEFLATNGLASSLGAIGQTAVLRSRRADTSRDPLYNQHKMYSEIYRMLGWYEPGSMKTNFDLPEYGYYIARSAPQLQKKLFALNVLHIVSPNPLTSVKGGNILRPFPMILRMMGALGGYLTRDEMILTVLACPNDRDLSYVSRAAGVIKKIRQAGFGALQSEINGLMSSLGINSKDVLPNYTRFPIAAMKWTGWAEGVSTKQLYNGHSITALRLTTEGQKTLNKINQAIDIRFGDLLDYSIDEQAAFTIWSNFVQLGKIGFNTKEYEPVIKQVETIASSIISDLNVKKYPEMLFFGYQEAPRDILERGNILIEE